ncbi:5515_t:CDS:2, partial [Paraglomus occultum]
MLEAISQSRERERKERLKHIFDEAKNEAGSKLEEKIEQADENYGSQSYWDNEDLIKNLKAKSARENPSSYRQRVSNKIEEEMERSGVREEELANNIRAAKRKIVSGEIEEPSLIVESEMIVISSIRQAEANRNLNEIVNQARQALTSRSQKAIEKVKNQILEFISNPNVFCQNSYNNRRSEVQNYLNKLENYSGSEGPINSDNRFPLSVVLSIAAVLLEKHYYNNEKVKAISKQKKKFEFNFQGREVVFEVDQLATKSEKSVLCRYVTFEEKFYAVGRIPSAFGKREVGSQEVQISNCVLSLDKECDPPAVMIGKEKDNFVCNPGSEALNNSPLELIVSATEEKIVMLDGAAREISEEELEKAISFAQREILILIGFFRHIANVLKTEEKKTINKENGLDILQDEWLIEKSNYCLEEELTKEYYKKNPQLEEAYVKDGRKVEEIRPLRIHIDYLPSVHGSAVFERGETKVLSVVTIGKISDKQLVDSIFSRYHKYFIHHYNFPAFAVNEIASYRAVSRREIGHGELVEKTFDYLLPGVIDFPYTIRVVSEIFSSDGSSSQASICATSLSLMAAGVPLIRPAAGIALGLFEGQIYTDLNGLEDKLGEMDFKIAGTEEGICSLQLDVKNKGITTKLLKECLKKARQARFYILTEMKNLILHPRSALPAQVIKCRGFYVEKETIGLIIGPRGKTINQLTEET